MMSLTFAAPQAGVLVQPSAEQVILLESYFVHVYQYEYVQAYSLATGKKWALNVMFYKFYKIC